MDVLTAILSLTIVGSIALGLSSIFVRR